MHHPDYLHHADRAEGARIADRLYAIDHGEIIFEGKPEQALEDANVMKALRSCP